MPPKRKPRTKIDTDAEVFKEAKTFSAPKYIPSPKPIPPIDSDAEFFQEAKRFSERPYHAPKPIPEIQKSYEKTEQAKEDDQTPFIGRRSFMSSHSFIGTPSKEEAAEKKVGLNDLLAQTNAADAAATAAMDYEFPMEDTNPIHTSHKSSRRNSFVEPGIDMSDSSVNEKIRHYERMNKKVLVEIAESYGINPLIYNPLTQRSDRKNKKQLAADI